MKDKQGQRQQKTVIKKTVRENNDAGCVHSIALAGG